MSLNGDEANVAISYYIEEIESNEKNNILDIEQMLNEIEMEFCDFHNELTIPQMINYHDNYTVKELLLICEYYGFAKEVKNNKFNKDEIISYLVNFENELNNSEVVFKRKNMWFYMNELKADKFMRKYIIWNK